MKKLIILPIQSFSDIITNSSSELFVTNTNFSKQQVVDILKEITIGFQDPMVFNVEEYRKACKTTKEFHYNSYYGAVLDNFRDLNDKWDIAEYRIKILNYFESSKYRKIDWELRIAFFDYLKDNFGFDMEEYEDYLAWREIIELPNSLKIADFFDDYEKSGKPLPKWWIPKKTIQSLDGKILILSDSDNTIPYETFELILDNLGGYHIHLG